VPKQKNPETGAQRNVIVGLTSAVHVTAARLRFLLNVKSYVRAAARDGER